MVAKTKQHPYYELMNKQDDAVEELKTTDDPLIIVIHLLKTISPDIMTDFGPINQIIGPLIQEREGYFFRIWFIDNSLRVDLYESVLSNKPSYALLKEKSLDESPRYFDSDCRRRHYEGRIAEIQTLISERIDTNRVLWQSKVKPHWDDSCCIWYELVAPELYNQDFPKYRVNLYASLAKMFIERSRNFYKENKKKCNRIEIKKWQDIFQHLVSYTKEDELKEAWLEIHSIAIAAFSNLVKIQGKNHYWLGFGLEDETKKLWVKKIKDFLINAKCILSDSKQDARNIEKVLSAKNLWDPTSSESIEPIEWIHNDISILHYLLTSHARALNINKIGIFDMINENKIFKYKDTFIDFSSTHNQEKYRNCKKETIKGKIDQLYKFLQEQ